MTKTKMQQITRASKRREDDSERFAGVEVVSFERAWGDGEWVATGEFRVPLSRVSEPNKRAVVSSDDTHAVLRLRIADSFSVRVPETARDLYLDSWIGW